MKKTVPDEGPLDARIVVVGESPGAMEMVEGRPFVGASGRRLNAWLYQVGLRREDIRVCNVVPYKVVVAHLSREEGEHWVQDLRERLETTLADPYVLVPQGNLALYAATGKGRVPWHMRDGRSLRPGITDWRGSILATSLRGRQVKVIPTIHPAATFARDGAQAKRAAQYAKACRMDWRRIAAESKTREVDIPTSDHHINPSLSEVWGFVDEVQREAKVLCVDIETPFQSIDMVLTSNGWVERSSGFALGDLVCYKSGARKGQPRTKKGWGPASIACVGFAYRPEFSLTVPLRADTRDAVAALLALPVPKVMQNGAFDCYWLHSDGLPVTNFWWDTRGMHHLLDPTAPHSLQYLASVYTRRPFWKAEARSPEEVTKYANNFDALQSYCGLDVVGTLEIFHALHGLLEKQSLLPFYLRHYRDLLTPLLDISMRGIRVDEDARVRVRDELRGQVSDLQRRLEEVTGRELVAKTDISTKRLATYLYKDLGLPVQRRRNAQKKIMVTTDEVAIRKLMETGQGREKLRESGPLILRHRELKKKLELVADGLADADGRMRCGIGFITDTGRLTSQETPKGTGRNLMNIDRKMREVFVPDED